jgi:hypothetical protein
MGKNGSFFMQGVDSEFGTNPGQNETQADAQVLAALHRTTE